MRKFEVMKPNPNNYNTCYQTSDYLDVDLVGRDLEQD